MQQVTRIPSQKNVRGPKEPKYLKGIKTGIWVYFLLVIFEGALRKWVLPGLSTPLLVIRDPVLIVIIISSIQHNILLLRGPVLTAILIGCICIPLALLVGHGNLFVALYGARTLILHLPLVFIMGKVFNQQDVIKIGRVTLFIAVPMALLIALQFYSPQSAWVNRGIGGDESGAGFSGSLGFFRPPGTFSFTNGNTLFFSFAGMYAIYFWMAKVKLNKIILIAATMAVIISIPLSISRALFFQVGISLVFAALVILRRPEEIGKLIGVAACCVLVFLILSQASFFQTGISAFAARFDSANESEGGVQSVLVDRYLGGLVGALGSAFSRSIFGIGIGAGTNVGAQFLLGRFVLLGGEGEWGRIITEIGPLLGLIIIFMRLGITIRVARAGFNKLGKGDILPWMLLSFGALNFPQGNWGQPTSLGFSIFIGGLMMASLNSSGQKRRMAIQQKKYPAIPGQLQANTEVKI